MALLKGGGSASPSCRETPRQRTFKSVARLEEPFMPDKVAEVGDAEIEIDSQMDRRRSAREIFQPGPRGQQAENWIALNAAAQGKKPDGPVFLPLEWRLEPVARTDAPRLSPPWPPAHGLPWSLSAASISFGLSLHYHRVLGVLPFPDVNPSLRPVQPRQQAANGWGRPRREVWIRRCLRACVW